MEILTEKIHLRTEGKEEMIDLTAAVRKLLEDSQFVEGQVLLFVKGSTAAITTIEFESGLISDLKAFLKKIIPESNDYKHNQRWNDGNGHSHLRASLFQPHLTIPFFEGQLQLGVWQQILFLELDNKPHQREIIVQIIGKRSDA